MCLKSFLAASAAILFVANVAIAQTALERLESTLKGKPATAAAADPAGAFAVESPKPYLGFVPNETIDDGKGVRVDAVSKGGPAELGGLKAGDLITAIDGKVVKNLTDFDAIYGPAKVGQKLSVSVLRAGKSQKLTITLAARPAAATTAATDEPGEAPPTEPALTDPAAAPPTLRPSATPPLTLPDPAATTPKPAPRSPFRAGRSTTFSLHSHPLQTCRGQAARPRHAAC